MDVTPAKPCKTNTPTISQKVYKDFDDNYFVKVYLDEKNDKIIILCYETTELENKRYEIMLTKTDLNYTHQVFKMYDKLEEIYEMFFKNFESKRYTIKNSNDDDKLIIDLDFIININKQNVAINFSLNLEENTNGDFSNDYNYILKNEIIRLKKKYDKEILELKNENKLINEQLDKQRQLIDDLLNSKSIANNKQNIYSNKANTLNIIYKDIYKDNNSNNSNKNYNSSKSISNKNKKDQNLKGKKLTNKDLNYLENNPNLEKVNLSGLSLTNINLLKKCRFKKAIVFDISNNQIQDLSVLKEFQFQKINELYLNHNKIQILEPLASLDLTHLQRLNLSYNNIEDLNSFYRINAPQLKYLNLSHNNIDDITVLSTTQFNDLKELYLNDNNINLEVNKDIIEYLSNKITQFTYI